MKAGELDHRELLPCVQTSAAHRRDEMEAEDLHAASGHRWSDARAAKRQKTSKPALEEVLSEEAEPRLVERPHRIKEDGGVRIEMDTRPSNRSYLNDPSIAQPIDYMVPGERLERGTAFTTKSEWLT